jgi:hypothetical protein
MRLVKTTRYKDVYGMEVLLHTVLTSSLDWCESFVSRRDHRTPIPLSTNPSRLHHTDKATRNPT